VLIYPSTTPAGTGLTGQYFTNSSSTYSSKNNFNPTNLVMTTVDPVIDFTWGTSSLPFTNSGYYTVRWTGQVLPQFSETYFLMLRPTTESSCGLMINSWLTVGAHSRPAIALGQSGCKPVFVTTS
jgi:hypothetical protein